MMVKVYDPGGTVDWRSLVTWYAFGTSPSTRDTAKDVDAVFLYVSNLTTAVSAVPGAKTYVVAAADSLSKIAQKFYGNANLWTRIYQANKALIGPNPNKIRSGVKAEYPVLA